MATWHAQDYGAYATESTEAKDNAVMAWGILKALGWSLNAMSAFWGNVAGESGYNPWRWEGDEILGADGESGYGFVQWTPATKYIQNSTAKSQPGFAPNYQGHPGAVSDASAQLHFMDVWSGGNQYYATGAYPENWTDFKTSTKTPEYLASAWLYNFERPAEPSATEAYRQAMARHWYDYLGGVTPPTPGKKSKFPFWLLLSPF